MIQRYKHIHMGTTIQDSDGEFVRYADIEPLLKAADERRVTPGTAPEYGRNISGDTASGEVGSSPTGSTKDLPDVHFSILQAKNHAAYTCEILNKALDEINAVFNQGDTYRSLCMAMGSFCLRLQGYDGELSKDRQKEAWELVMRFKDLEKQRGRQSH